MTGYELEMLKEKERQGTITQKELRRLKQHRRSGGKTSEGYSEKRRKSFQD